jgi:hypothetical protein
LPENIPGDILYAVHYSILVYTISRKEQVSTQINLLHDIVISLFVNPESMSEEVEKRTD